MLFTSAKRIDAEGGELAACEIGELCLKGPHVSLGYWRTPEATAAVLDAEGWFHTGDKAQMDEEGYFYIAGRTTEMFISGGVNVYPAEIEAELLLHPLVEDAAVIGVEDERWGEIGVAFVVPRGNAVLSEETIRAFLSTKVARYKVPKHFILVRELPRTAYGKIAKPELRRQFANRK